MRAKEKRTKRLTLHMARLEELLVAPETRPLEGRFEERPGVDRILDRLRAQYTRRLAGIRSTLILDEAPSPETRRRVEAALAAQALYQDERLGEQLVIIRRDGLRALVKGLLFALACMIVSAAVGQLTLLPELMRNLISGGIVVAGWVALWNPLELLLYDRWQVARDRKLYRLIAAMEIVVEPAPGAAGATSDRRQT